MFAWLSVVAETYDADVVEPRRVGFLLRAGQRKSGIGFQPVIARNTGWKPVPHFLSDTYSSLIAQPFGLSFFRSTH